MAQDSRPTPLEEDKTTAVVVSDDVVVRVWDSSEDMRIRVTINDHAYDMLRKKTEPLGNALRRLRIKISQLQLQCASGEGTKKGKKKKRKLPSELHAELGDLHVQLLINGHSVDEATENCHAWVEGALLQVGGSKSLVRINPPSVKMLEVPGICMVGHALVPRVEIEFASFSKCQWRWRRHLRSESSISLAFPMPQSPASHWPTVSTDYVYWPTVTDVDHTLLVECTPANKEGVDGVTVSASSKMVTRGPSNCPFEQRHLHTLHVMKSSEGLRVVSYNILADVYAASDWGRQVLYPYCPSYALDMDYRQCLIERELLGYHADVICLQELGERCYEQYFKPVMEQKGFSCHYKGKAGQMMEGEGILLRKSKLQVVGEWGVSLTEFLLTHPSASSLLAQLRKTPRLLSFLAGKHSIVLLVIAKVLSPPLLSSPLPPSPLEDSEIKGETDQVDSVEGYSSSENYVVVANTHLYYHPKGDHIRLLQAHIATLALSATVERFKEEMAAKGEVNVRAGTIFCGDFNSSPLNGVCEYFVTGKIPEHHSDWSAAAQYETARFAKHMQIKMDKNMKMATDEAFPHKQSKKAVPVGEPEQEKVEEEEEEHGVVADLLSQAGVLSPSEVFEQTSTIPVPEPFEGVELEHSFQMFSGCGQPMYTNFTTGFQDTLDYIFVDHTYFSGAEVIPFPSHEEVTANVALPSHTFPSDHIALVCDLKYAQQH